MAKLPNRPFMFNYNAREYDSSTHTFPKTQGQLFDEDLELSNNPAGYADDYVDFSSNDAWAKKDYGSIDNNPFNRFNSNVPGEVSFTFIYKTSGFTSLMENLFANRSGGYNYMVRGNIFHTSTAYYLELTPDSHPEICVIRVNADGSSIRKFVDSEGNTLQSTSASSISWGNSSQGIAFFAGQTGGGEYFTNKFYWMYCSLEALTDEEILQVIKYNENTTTFELDSTGNTFAQTGGTSTTNLEASLSWSASTSSDWFSFSPESGDSGSTSITVTVPGTKFGSRAGSIVFEDTEGNTAEYLVKQDGMKIGIPVEKLYRNGRRIN